MEQEKRVLTDEEKEDQAYLYLAFLKWTDEEVERSEEDRDRELYYFSEVAKNPKKGAMALSFLAFLGGFNAAMDYYEALEKAEAERKGSADHGSN